MSGTLETLRPGAWVTRYFEDKDIGVMRLQVTAVTPTIVVCGDWVFCAQTGAEIDSFLGWGPDFGVTGSHIRRER